MRVEEQFESQLMQIEAVFVKLYRKHPSLMDSQVERVIEFCIRDYNARIRGTDSPACKLGDLDLVMFNDVLKISDELTDQGAEFSVNELVPCLKRIRKSIRRWNKVGGRQGYLTYINQFL
jgi:hypothetical protein